MMKNECSRCNLGPCVPITHRGNLEADIMLIAEAIGLEEEKQRKPLVGPSGQLLDKMFESIGLDTNKDMLLSNCLMCRPRAPKDSGRQNLTPSEEQLNACFPYVRNLIRIVKPKVIIACGRIALGELLGDRKVKMKDYEGKWIKYNREYSLLSPDQKHTIEIKPDIDMFVMCHPSYILRQKSFMNDEEYKQCKDNIKNYMNDFKEEYKE
jgi:DNA polymerase